MIQDLLKRLIGRRSVKEQKAVNNMHMRLNRVSCLLNAVARSESDKEKGLLVTNGRKDLYAVKRQLADLGMDYHAWCESLSDKSHPTQRGVK